MKNKIILSILYIMENTINNAGEMCQNNEACAIDWNKLQGWNNKEGNFESSLTHLGGLEGSDEEDVYGAEFMPVDMHTPYYERMISQTVEVPWLGQDMEQTFMNRTKILNEPPVQAYKELKLSSIPQQNYESVEGFGENTQNLVFKILCVIFLVILIYYLMKEIK
jgi:hypothetical protein